MRLHLIKDVQGTISYRSVIHAITWIYMNGIVGSTIFIKIHPLVRVYWNICKDNRLQAVKTDVESRRFVLILFASLVLL